MLLEHQGNQPLGLRHLTGGTLDKQADRVPQGSCAEVGLRLVLAPGYSSAFQHHLSRLCPTSDLTPVAPVRSVLPGCLSHGFLGAEKEPGPLGA